MELVIPKIIHQIWIGPKPAPIKLMNTWKDKHPDFEYIFWNEEEFIKRNMFFSCQDKIDEMEEYCGKTDIMRWEILYKYGGIYIDADSICIENLNDELLLKSFASYENEVKRAGLIAIGTMGFSPKHIIPKKAVNYIRQNDVSTKKTGRMAWENTGPVLLTNIYNSNPNEYKKIFTILPSYYFLPSHFTGQEYNGHAKIYAFQEWGSTRSSYDNMNNTELSQKYITPPTKNSVSILISSYNTKSSYIKECLDSIKHQVGYFNMEIVWINDGSDKLNTTILKKYLENFEKTTRFTKVIYKENETNMGIGYSLNVGITLCNNEFIIKMDSDDIMVEDRILKQLIFMSNNPSIMVCGAQISMFKDNINNIVNVTNHSSLTWDEYKKKPIHWLVNHPTLCYRKSAIIGAGNYDTNFKKVEDFELMLRVLKKYKYIHNLHESLLYYRLHPSQTTHNGCIEGHDFWLKERNKIISRVIKEN